jgi:8-oxo-dGTP diphosphatase
MALAQFVALHRVSETGFTKIAQPSFAVMVARAPEGVVLVFNLWRKVWELPGGLIDPGESPRTSAERELAEEAGCAAQNTACLGMVEVHDGHTHFGAVFSCEVAQADPAFMSEETGGVAFWHAGHPPSPLGHTDAGILQHWV